jgi:PTS system cellobiose-specific IIC component
MHGAVYALIAKPLTTLGGSFPALLIAVLFTHVLWSIGIHGTMVALSVFYPIWASLDMQNLAAYNSGAPIPNIVSMQFFFFVAFAGGAGNTIALIINMLTSKVASNKALGRLGLIPGLFGINEPIIFGMPIVMNPLLIMPFILSPMITTILGYIVCKMGIIAAPSGIASIPGAPIIVNQFLMGGWTWAVFEVVIISISYLIYFPFFKILEKQQLSNQNTEDAQGREAIIKQGFENATK